MKKSSLVALLILMLSAARGQQIARQNDWLDLAATAGLSKGSTSISYVHNWKLGRPKKLEVGIGARFTSFFGKRLDYTTAPAKWSRTNTTPFLIVLAGQKTENWDTLNVASAFTNSLNLSLNAGYCFSKKWSVVFNIDLGGISFGKTSPASLTTNGSVKTEPGARPATWNVLLTGDLDYGSLNSEFSLKYKIGQRWAVRAIYQFLFTEYKTSGIYQTAPDGTSIYRFRNKANNWGAGLSYFL